MELDKSYSNQSVVYEKLVKDDPLKVKSWLRDDTVGAWRYHRIFQVLDPLLKGCPHASWLTIGDGRYGTDARYIKKNGGSVVATDISDILLKEAKEFGHFDEYSQENAESLSFADISFDFVLCKEAYHHFPRPQVALYEMLRVAKVGVVLIEPNDWYANDTLLHFVFIRVKDIIKRLLGKNPDKHQFESSGNYAYTVSVREMEKIALGLNYLTIAFKGINDSYVKGSEDVVPGWNMVTFKTRAKIAFHNFLSRLGIAPYSILSLIIFKTTLENECLQQLKEDGYKFINLPKNPFIK